MTWSQLLCDLADNSEPFVIVTVAATRGSTPRETGAKMFVTATRTIGTIGGGQLEYECTSAACLWFREKTPAQTYSRRFTLGANCGQCCGGVAEVLFEQVEPKAAEWLSELKRVVENAQPAIMVTAGDSRTGVTKRFVVATDETPGDDIVADDALAQRAVDLLRRNGPAIRETVALTGNLQVPVLFEPLQASRFEIVVFGAGHVGSALVANLAGLHCQVSWVDSRPHIFPDTLPGNASAMTVAEPQLLVDTFGAGVYYLVMTHSHQLDQEICARILSRDDFAYCGLIGSRSKRRQFEKRLSALGLSDRQLQRLTCPIGIAGISGKTPAEIAIATTAQLLQLRETELRRQARPVTVNPRQVRQ